MQLEESESDHVTVNDSEKSLLESKGLHLTGPQIAAFLIYKSARIASGANASDWFDLLKYQDQCATGKAPFWIGIRDAILQVCSEKNMTRNTINTNLCTIRRVIKTLHPHFDGEASQYITTRSERTSAVRTANSTNRVEEGTPYSTFLIELRRVTPLRTRQKSQVSVDMTVQDVHALCSKLDIDSLVNADEGIDKEHILEEVTKIIDANRTHVQSFLQTQCTKAASRYAVIFKNILGHISLAEMTKVVVNSKKREAPPTEEEDGDRHRLSPSEVEAMKNEIRTTLDAIVFYILFTTGLRVGGLVNIKMGDVASYDAAVGWTLKTTGKTLEKGNKIRHFPIAECAKAPLLKWLSSDRPFVQSPYLIPGQYANTHMSGDNIWKIFKRMGTSAGIEADRAHPHVARHTVGFMLAERGNSMDYIAKFLGHASTKTTEAYYVKYSTEELCDRMDIPWLSDTLKTAALPPPPCLTTTRAVIHEPETTDAERPPSRKERRQQKKQKLQSTLNTIVSLQQHLCSQ